MCTHAYRAEEHAGHFGKWNTHTCGHSIFWNALPFFLWYPLDTCQIYGGKMIKIVDFTLCNALGQRHYWNQAHLAQAPILVMPTAEGITLHILQCSAGLVIVAASWAPLLKVVNTTNGYRNGWVNEPANLFPSKLTCIPQLNFYDSISIVGF